MGKSIRILGLRSEKCQTEAVKQNFLKCFMFTGCSNMKMVMFTLITPNQSVIINYWRLLSCITLKNCKTSWANARVKLHSQVHFGSKKVKVLTLPVLTDLSWPVLTWAGLTRPVLTWPVLAWPVPDLTYPDLTYPNHNLPDYHSNIP